MKTFAHINQSGDVVGIGMIYYESGALTEEVQALVDALGEDEGIKAYGAKVKQDASLVAVVIDTDEMPGGNGSVYDRTFRNAFKHGGGKRVDVDVPKAKEITHEKRRAKRAAELAPLDVEATIPAKAQEAEAKRQQVRVKHAVLQTSIDAATTPAQLKAIIETEGL